MFYFFLLDIRKKTVIVGMLAIMVRVSE